MAGIGITNKLPTFSPQWRTQPDHVVIEENISVRWIDPSPTEELLYYSGVKGDQRVWVFRQKDSTEDDPVVRIAGHCRDQDFEFTCRLSDIDPRNASYAELCALVGWERKTNPTPDDRYFSAVPLGMEVGNILQRQNFVSRSSSYLVSGKFSQSIADHAKVMLSLYQKLIPPDQTPTDDIQAYSAYRRMADDALMNLMKLV